MSLACMPFLVVNMGGEMIFILDQRLKAQCVAPDKVRATVSDVVLHRLGKVEQGIVRHFYATKVINDVAMALFNKDFVKALTVPQQAYSETSLRQIFDRLAHSSIMRLSEASMDKLFDLMVMGFKLQMCSLTAPRELVNVTLTHVECIKALVDDPKVLSSIADFEIKIKRMTQTEDDGGADAGGSMLEGDWFCLRRSVLNVFLGKRVKVSMFMNEGIQRSNGSFVLPWTLDKRADSRDSGAREPEKVGRLMRWDRKGRALADEMLYLPGSMTPSAPYIPHRIAEGWNFYSNETKLKANVQQQQSHASCEPVDSGGDADDMERALSSLNSPKGTATPSLDPFGRSTSSVTYAQQRRQSVDIPEAAACEDVTRSLNSLASLIATTNSAATAKNNNNFKINLFADDGYAPRLGGADKSPSPVNAERRISIDASDRVSNSHSRNLQSMLEDMHVDDGGAAAMATNTAAAGGGLAGADEPDGSGGEDLLSLMDDAAA